MSFDIHDHRHRLKQLRDGGETKLFENRDGMACPACGEPFSRLFSTRKTRTRFPAPGDARFCLVAPDGEFVHLFSH
jgi:hypothetical protein